MMPDTLLAPLHPVRSDPVRWPVAPIGLRRQIPPDHRIRTLQRRHHTHQHPVGRIQRPPHHEEHILTVTIPTPFDDRFRMVWVVAHTQPRVYVVTDRTRTRHANRVRGRYDNAPHLFGGEGRICRLLDGPFSHHAAMRVASDARLRSSSCTWT